MTTLHLHNVAAQGSKPQYLWRVVSIGAALLLATLTTWSPAHAETVPASGSTGSAESSLQPDEVDPRARDIWTPSVSTADLVMNISQMDGITVERQDRDFEIHALPDTEVILSPTTIHFNIAEFVSTQGGFLERYREKVSGTWLSGAEIVEKVAQTHSVNPRLLLAILEFRAHWVTDPARPGDEAFHFPIETVHKTHQGLHLQLTWTADALNHGYYSSWQGDFLEPQNERNAGMAALEYLLAGICPVAECEQSLLDTYRRLFGDPWAQGANHPEFDLEQPELALPFPGSNLWILTGGPHPAWGAEASLAALDFAPKWDPDRRTSDGEVVAVADGTIVRLDHGVLVLDLDGDGYEQTGWVMLYLHVMAAEGIVEGSHVRQGQIIGEASSAGGIADGDHLHIARKYNGEWIPAEGPVPFDLGGWKVRAGVEEYDGELYKAGGWCHSGEATVPIGGVVRTTSPHVCRPEILA